MLVPSGPAGEDGATSPALPSPCAEGVPDDLQARFAEAMARLLDHRPAALGVAVSGGGDSVAAMHLASRWAAGGTRLHVVTVDHGLREGAAAEAEAVARQTAALGLPHAVLRWRWDGAGNLQAAAREGRRALIGGWAGRMDLAGVILGHTMDDRAETLVMRLARGSGVEGLAAMEARVLPVGGNAPFLRPLLGVSRAALRGWLRARGVGWIEDPSNDDPRFERVRARRAIEALRLDVLRLAATAERMARARRALEARAHDVARTLLRPGLPGGIRLDREGLARVEEDTRLRILAGALRCVAGAVHRPREADLLRAANADRACTLHGCAVRPEGGVLAIHREAAAVAGLRALPPGPWDGAWHLHGPAAEGCEIRALGEVGLRRIGAGVPRGAPRAALAAQPALWRDDALVGFAPLGHGAPHRAEWRPAGGPFPDCLLARGGEEP